MFFIFFFNLFYYYYYCGVIVGGDGVEIDSIIVVVIGGGGGIIVDSKSVDCFWLFNFFKFFFLIIYQDKEIAVNNANRPTKNPTAESINLLLFVGSGGTTQVKFVFIYG